MMPHLRAFFTTLIASDRASSPKVGCSNISWHSLVARSPHAMPSLRAVERHALANCHLVTNTPHGADSGTVRDTIQLLDQFLYGHPSSAR
jgi:hypothetical protein